MKIMEYKEVTTKKEITVAIKCNVCGKAIDGKFWTLATSHRDWGNDSIESFEYFDLCSHKCIQEKLKEYYYECEVSCTQEFDLEQAYFKPSEETK